MKQHGGWLQRPQETADNHDRVAANNASAPPRGFRHYRLADRDQPTAERDLGAVTTRAQRLELRMNAEIGWDAPPPALDGAEAPIKKTTQPDNRDNPYIPSGYTYFSQFVAHDMVATRVPFWATAKLTRDTVNDRGTRLQLDSLYGGGPTQNPIIYAAADPNDLSRAKLQIGKAGPLPGPDGNATGVCPFRDIARLKPVNTLFDLNGLTEALVADPRNDDHALISQLTMVFCHLHNARHSADL